MTVSSTANRVVYSGNAATTNFPFAFKVQSPADLVVIYTDATGADFTLSPAQYGAAGFGLDAGGAVTYPVSGAPIAVGTRLTIYRDVAVTQPAAISNQGAMWPSVIESALDRATYILQRVADSVSRALVISPTDSGTLTPLPNAVQRANSVLGFDGAGQPYAAQLVAGLGTASAWLVANFFPSASALAARGSIGAAGVADNNAFTGSSTHAGTEAMISAAFNEARGAAIASAATTDVGAATGNTVHVTGIAAIAALGSVQAGARRKIVFDGILTLTHNATSLILLTGANITTAAGDVAEFISEGGGNWRMTGYARASGLALAAFPVIAPVFLGADVLMNSTAAYQDGPSIVLGPGTYEVTASLTIAGNNAASQIYAKLWNGGATVLASGVIGSSGTANSPSALCAIHLTGQIVVAVSETVKISARNISVATGRICFNNSGESKDSMIIARRIA